MKHLVILLFLASFTGCSSSNITDVSENMSEAINNQTAELLLVNGKVYTSSNAYAEAVAIREGKVLFVGSKKNAEKYTSSQTQVVDLHGQLLLPGFIDNHIHIGEGGEVNCVPQNNLPLSDQISMLAHCGQDVAAGVWIIGYGSDFLLEVENLKSNPRQILDEVFPDNPVIIMDYTSHAQFVNSMAYQRAQVNKNTEDPVGGIYMKDLDGELNGILLDNAGDRIMEMAVNNVAGKFDVFVEGILYGLQLAKENGITTVGDGRTYWRRGMLEAWKAVETDNLLSARVSIRPWIYPDIDKAEQISFLQNALQNDINRLLIVNQVKMYSDGVPEYGTGRVIAPYKFTWFPELPNGLNYTSQLTMTEWLKELYGLGYGAHIHAIGDLGVRQTLNAIEALRNDGSLLKYNMTHLSMVDPQDIGRFHALDVDADLQLSSAATYEERANEISSVIGHTRAHQIHHTPIRELFESGANVVLSSDWSVNSISPLSAISFAVEQGSLSAEQAIDAYTINAATALGLSDITGSIEVGKSADLTLLNRDITIASPAQIRSANVMMTVLKGKVIYRR